MERLELDLQELESYIRERKWFSPRVKIQKEKKNVSREEVLKSMADVIYIYLSVVEDKVKRSLLNP